MEISTLVDLFTPEQIQKEPDESILDTRAEQRRAYKKAYRAANREQRLKAGREYYHQNKEASRVSQARWKSRNLERMKARQAERYREIRGTWRQDISHKVTGARIRAKARNIPFDLDLEWISETVTRLEADPRCPVSGIVMVAGQGMERNRPLPNAPAFDRRDPEKGYTKGNVRIVCHFVNNMKSVFYDATVTEYILLWAEAIKSKTAGEGSA